MCDNLENNIPPTPEQPKPRSIAEVDDAATKYRLDKKKHYAAVQWYALYVQPGHELQVYDYLSGFDLKDMQKRRRGKAKAEDLVVIPDPAKRKMECFVALKRVHVKYADRMVWKERVQIPGVVFVHTSLDDRDPLFHSPITEYVSGFLVDRVRHWPQPIPKVQMLEFMALCNADWLKSLEKPTYKIGDKVLVLEGPLTGHVARLYEIRETVSRGDYERDRAGQIILDNEGNPINKRKTTLCVQLNSQLVATFEVDADKVVKAPANAPDYGFYG